MPPVDRPTVAPAESDASDSFRQELLGEGGWAAARKPQGDSKAGGSCDGGGCKPSGGEGSGGKCGQGPFQAAMQNMPGVGFFAGLLQGIGRLLG